MQIHGAFAVEKEFPHPKEDGIKVIVRPNGKRLYQSSQSQHLHGDTFTEVFATFTTLREAVEYRG